MSARDCNSTSSVPVSKFLPLNVEGLPPEIIRKAEVELNETPERKREALKELGRLILTEKEFQPLMDETFLLRFLRARKCNTEAAFKTLRNFYTYKARYRGILTDIYPSELEHVIRMNVLNIQPYRDQEASVVVVAKIANLDLNRSSVEEFITTTLLGVEHILRSEVTQISGVVAVYNFKAVSLRLIRHISSPTLLFRFFRGLQFQLHGSNLENLHKQVPPEILPSEFGGHLGPMSSKNLEEGLLNTDIYFSNLFKYGYRENKADWIRRRSSGIGLFL